MGQFSWLDCESGKQIIDDYPKDVYLLVPKQFAGTYGPRILEPHYDGYGEFGGYDVYDLIADWNKDSIPEIIRRAANGNWTCSIGEDDIALMNAFYNGKPIESVPNVPAYKVEKRWIGIVMSCYDKDNERLEYPIKITYNPYAVYEQCAPSPSDPNQGWPEMEDDDEEASGW